MREKDGEGESPDERCLGDDHGWEVRTSVSAQGYACLARILRIVKEGKWKDGIECIYVFTRLLVPLRTDGGESHKEV